MNVNKMKKNIINEEAYNILISKKPTERSKFLSNAIIFYDRYLNHTMEVINETQKAEIKEALYEMIRDGEITMDTFKRAIYDLDNIDSEERQEEIDWYINNLR